MIKLPWTNYVIRQICLPRYGLKCPPKLELFYSVIFYFIRLFAFRIQLFCNNSKVPIHLIRLPSQLKFKDVEWLSIFCAFHITGMFWCNLLELTNLQPSAMFVQSSILHSSCILYSIFTLSTARRFRRRKYGRNLEKMKRTKSLHNLNDLTEVASLHSPHRANAATGTRIVVGTPCF